MRLTNITQIALPPGRLRSYGLRATQATGRWLPVSFDQERHVGEGERPASWMALAFELPGPVAADHVARAWQATVARHGTLRTVFSRIPDSAASAAVPLEASPVPLEASPEPLASPEAGSEREAALPATLALAEFAVDGGEWQDHPIPEGSSPRDVIRQLFDTACRPYARPSHRLVLLEPVDGNPRLVIGSDHAHVDMWSMLVLARDLHAALREVEAGRDPLAAAPSARSFSEHTALLASAPPVPGEVRRRWQRIMESGGGLMPQFPLDLGDVSAPVPEVVEVRDVLDPEGLARLADRADRHGVRLLPFTISVLAEATRALSGKPLRAVFPVHSRHAEEWHDAVGWFITNSVLECDSADPQACAVAVKESLRLGSYPLAPIFGPLGGMPVTPAMFAISWLDGRKLPIELDPALRVQHVSASLRVDGVMIWFIVGNDGMHLRCRYPDTAMARTNVGRWLDRLEAGLRAPQ